MALPTGTVEWIPDAALHTPSEDAGLSLIGTYFGLQVVDVGTVFMAGTAFTELFGLHETSAPMRL